MSKQHSLSVDIAKGVAIIAIVLGHIGFTYPDLTLIKPENFLFRLWPAELEAVFGQ